MLGVFRKLIIFKPKYISDEKYGNMEALRDTFISSNGWLKNFMPRKNISLRRKRTIAQKDKFNLSNKLVGYVMQVQRLTMNGNYPPNCVIAMNKTAVSIRFNSISFIQVKNVVHINNPK